MARAEDLKQRSRQFMIMGLDRYQLEAGPI